MIWCIIVVVLFVISVLLSLVVVGYTVDNTSDYINYDDDDYEDDDDYDSELYKDVDNYD